MGLAHGDNVLRERSTRPLSLASHCNEARLSRAVCSSLPTIDEEGDQIRLNDLVSGDIVVRTGSDLPPSQNVGRAGSRLLPFRGRHSRMRANGLAFRR